MGVGVGVGKEEKEWHCFEASHTQQTPGIAATQDALLMRARSARCTMYVRVFYMDVARAMELSPTVCMERRAESD